MSFNGTMAGSSTHTVCLRAGSVTKLLTVAHSGNSGTLSRVQVPVAPDHPCMEPKDAARTLPRSAPASVSGVRHSANLALMQGDSNEDDLIEISATPRGS
jgi:hypothetical protein